MSTLSSVARAATSQLAFKKRLPSEFGSLAVWVTPAADMRVLYPGFDRCARDLQLVSSILVKPGHVVWDIGSNLGIFSVCAAAKAGPEGQVFSVEADPEYAALQHRTFMQLPKDAAPCSVLSAAIADRVSILDFGVHERGSARSGLVETATAAPASRKPVMAVTLDFLLNHWPAPNVVKIDVEGADLLALRGAIRLLKDVRPAIYTEMTEETYPLSSEIFRAAGYDLRRLDSGRLTPLTSFGPYVVALPPP
jgi:FkbM family methyltransferase